MSVFRCGACDSFVRAGGQQGLAGKGECRRVPPCVVAIPARHPISGEVGMQTTAAYPPVTRDYPACGEYIPKEEEDDAHESHGNIIGGG